MLDQLSSAQVPAGTILFQPGDSVKGYVIVLSGRIGVHLVGASGREILLYDVTRGTSCIQSTFGLLGGKEYTAEAVAETDAEIVLLPSETFLSLLDRDAEFRRQVFNAFANRMQDTMQLLERVAFLSVDARLAEYLLAHVDAEGHLAATQQEIAAAIGSAREVVSRRLDTMSKRGWLNHARGRVHVQDPDALRYLLAENAG